MSKRTSPLLPSTERRLRDLGERIRLARLRRKLPAASLAERAGMSPMTLRGIERGGPGVTIGAHAAVLQVLGLEADLDYVGAADAVGRQLQDSRLRPDTGGAAKRAKTAQVATPPRAKAVKPPVSPPQQGRQGRTSAPGVAAEDLAKLVALSPAARKKR